MSSQKRTESPPRSPLPSILTSVFAYGIFPGIIIALLWEPNILNGFIDHLEAGQYLSGVNGIFRGQVPYKDFFLLFGSLQLYIIAVVMALFGKTLAVMKLYFYATYLLSFLVIYLLGLSIYRNRVLPFIMTLVCIVEMSHPFWATSFDYGRMGLGLAVLILLIMFLRTRRTGWLVGAGAACAFSLFYTVDIGIFTGLSAVFFIISDSLFREGRKLRDALAAGARKSAVFALGFSLFALPYGLFLASRGGLAPFLKTAFYVMPFYHLKAWAQPVTPFPFWALVKPVAWPHLFGSMTFKHYLPAAIYAAIFLFLFFSVMMRRWDDRKTMIALLAFYGALIFKGSFRAMAHVQFFVTLPVCILSAGIFIEDALYRARRPGSGKAGPVIAAVILTLSLLYFLSSEKWYYKTLAGWVGYELHKDALSAGYFKPIPLAELDLVRPRVARMGAVMIPRWQDEEMGGVTEYIDTHTAPDEALFAFPEHGIYAFLADRPSFSRFHIAGFARTVPAWREELLEELIAEKPRYLIVDTRLSHLAGSIGRKEEMLPEVGDFIRRQYAVEQEFGKTLIYRAHRK